MPRFWIGVASREHVRLGVAGGFAQLCHGKAQPLRRMAVGDAVYSFEMAPGFVPFRRNIEFLPTEEAPIRPLLDQLDFIRDKSRWGYAFRFGHLEIGVEDFARIAGAMQLSASAAGWPEPDRARR